MMKEPVLKTTLAAHPVRRARWGSDRSLKNGCSPSVRSSVSMLISPPPLGSPGRRRLTAARAERRSPQQLPRFGHRFGAEPNRVIQHRPFLPAQLELEDLLDTPPAEQHGHAEVDVAASVL